VTSVVRRGKKLKELGFSEQWLDRNHERYRFGIAW
jgi:hypothetical protein